MNQEHETRYVRVIVDRAIHRELDYSVPENLAERVGVGSRVRVPFRDKSALATVVAIPEQSEAKGIRPIEAIIGDAPVLSEHVARTGEMDRHLLLLPDRNGDAQYASASDPARGSRLEKTVVRATRAQHRPRRNRKTAKTRTAAGRTCWRRSRNWKSRYARRSSCGKPSLDNQTLRALVKRGLAELREEAVVRDPHGDEQFIATSNLVLNEEQTHALNEVEQALDAPENARPILLHGVTGSGKTEIYLQAIRAALDRGRTAIVLVPEISLTPQTVERFKGRFAEAQDDVAVLHSHLSEGERHDEWHKIHSGRARIVIGARSAVFAPLKNLGLIVVDEEHETTYKQEESPRYHARDVAIVRAKIEKCVVVLGSATPSLESYHNATIGKYRLITLTQRVDQKQMPLMRVVDLRQERRKEKKAAILSERLSQAIADRLEKREQTILFLNRRGFSTSLLCSNCGEARNCPNCSVALTFHRHPAVAGRLSCHLCGHTAAVPKKCPACGQDALIYHGFGTEKVESTVAQIFPKAVVRRMDADSMTRKEAYRETLRNFRTGKIDILVGTQMIAKGLHFPNVTLVVSSTPISPCISPISAQANALSNFSPRWQDAPDAARQPAKFSCKLTHRSVPRFNLRVTMISLAISSRSSSFANAAISRHSNTRSSITVRSAHEGRAKLSAETLKRRLSEALPEEFILGDATSSATGKTTRPIPFPHFDPRRSHHAPQPACARNSRQTALPRRRHRHSRCRSLSVAIKLGTTTNTAISPARSSPGSAR